jgi:hypothetical protein
MRTARRIRNLRCYHCNFINTLKCSTATKGNQSMDKRQLLNSINSQDQLDLTAISSLANRQEREKAVRDFVNSVVKTEGKEIILVSVVRR